MIAAEEARGSPPLVVHEVEQRELHSHEGLDPLQQLARDRGRIVGAAEGGRDRGEGLELRLADRAHGPAPAPERPESYAGQNDPDDDRRDIEPDAKHARLAPG